MDTITELAVVKIKTKSKGWLVVELLSAGEMSRGPGTPFPSKGNSYYGFSILPGYEIYLLHQGVQGKWWVISDPPDEEWEGEKNLNTPIMVVPDGLPKIPEVCSCGYPSLRECSYDAIWNTKISILWTCWGCGKKRRRTVKCVKE